MNSDTVTADVADQLGLPKQTRGVVVTEIDPDSPAEKAGLKRTDVIVAINGHPVSSWEELRLLVAQVVPHTVAQLKVFRDGKVRMVAVTVGEVIENPNELLAGVDVAPLSAEARRRLGLTDQRLSGLIITVVSEESPYRDRLAEHMVILEINRTPVLDLAAAKQTLVSGRNLLAVFDGRSVRFVVIFVAAK